MGQCANAKAFRVRVPCINDQGLALHPRLLEEALQLSLVALEICRGELVCALHLLVLGKRVQPRVVANLVQVIEPLQALPHRLHSVVARTLYSRHEQKHWQVVVGWGNCVAARSAAAQHLEWGRGLPVLHGRVQKGSS